MKKLLLAAIFSILAGHTTAQNNDTVYFYPRQACIDIFYAFENTVDYNEKLLFTGIGVQYDDQGTPYSGRMFFFVNHDTGTWIMLNSYDDGITCMINAGYAFEPYVGIQFDER
jgi:hypothetical protein